MALQVLWCSNGLCHVNLDVSVAQWRKDNIFGNFGVWHANWGWKKNGVYTSLIKKKISVVHTSRKIAYTKMYRTKKLINQFLNKVEYPV